MKNKFSDAFNRFRRQLSLEGLVRLIADILMVNLAVLMALTARLFFYLAFELSRIPAEPIDYTITLQKYITAYINAPWLLTIICIIVFSASGFYTYGRFYRGRYKILIILQAVSVAYIIFGALVYFTGDYTSGIFFMPRGAFFLSWVLTAALLVAARAWSYLWRKAAKAETTIPPRSVDGKVRTVLVIGGAGYIGSALLSKLLDRGYRVHLLDLLLYGTEPIQDYLDHPHLKVIQADFRQIDRVVEATRNADAVIHLGAIVGDPACALDEKLTIEINLMATRMIAEVAKGNGVSRFIFASTCSVYGASDQKLDERSALNPVSLYARSKIASEKVLLKMADDTFAPTNLRFGTIYGLSGRTRFDLVVNLLTAKALEDGKITIFGGDQWRPFIHVDDAAQAILMTLEAPLPIVRNQVINVGSNEQNYTIRQIGELVNKAVPGSEVIEMSANVDPRNYWVSFNKLQNVLQFKPHWTVEKGIHQVIEAIHSGRVGDYRDAKYSNVKFLTEEGMSRLARGEEGWAYQLLNESETGEMLAVDM